MKIAITRAATPEEADAILSEMQRRHDAGAELRDALAKHFTPGKLAAVIATLPEELQVKYQAQLAPRPVRRFIKIRTPRRK